MKSIMILFSILRESWQSLVDPSFAKGLSRFTSQQKSSFVVLKLFFYSSGSILPIHMFFNENSKILLWREKLYFCIKWKMIYRHFQKKSLINHVTYWCSAAIERTPFLYLAKYLLMLSFLDTRCIQIDNCFWSKN